MYILKGQKIEVHWKNKCFEKLSLQVNFLIFGGDKS